jgi:hypothetical protein
MIYDKELIEPLPFYRGYTPPKFCRGHELSYVVRKEIRLCSDSDIGYCLYPSTLYTLYNFFFFS